MIARLETIEAYARIVQQPVDGRCGSRLTQPGDPNRRQMVPRLLMEWLTWTQAQREEGGTR